MITCPNCGKEVTEDVLHCGHCGHRMKKEVKKTMIGMGALNSDDLKRAIARSRESAEQAGDSKAPEATEQAAPEQASVEESKAGTDLPSRQENLVKTQLLDDFQPPPSDAERRPRAGSDPAFARTEAMDAVSTPEPEDEIPGPGQGEKTSESASGSPASTLGDGEPAGLEPEVSFQDSAGASPLDDTLPQPEFSMDTAAGSQSSPERPEEGADPQAPGADDVPESASKASEIGGPAEGADGLDPLGGGEPGRDGVGDDNNPGDEPAQNEEAPSPGRASAQGRDLMQMRTGGARSSDELTTTEPQLDSMVEEEEKGGKKKLLILLFVLFAFGGCCVLSTVGFFVFGGGL